MKGFSKFYIVIAFLTCNLHYAQQAAQQEELSLDSGSLESQFEYLYIKSGNYNAEGKRYEVVRKINLDKIRNNVLDSINVANQKAVALKKTISDHEATISSLNGKLKETSDSLAAVSEEKDSMSFLGAQVSKGTYNFILWTIIIGLFLLLLLFIYKFRSSNFLTQQAKTNLSELETEYEDHRRRALEREQRISRQLQDEINKYKKSK
ncbi:tRNA (guanine-N1)-methyltransferase [uncultured Eudoraea sp.]|uniref:tRNA (guanine-N1)-methyltransferase n=1 Tax=uncultured Eudoraea sp. TaxID=1035614 RepID=UPI002639A906|nr:tRNA (guanine-N1)-methyltransferase [uncultured Eudoraea sp.]